ncbi:hypothetical protein Bca4012_031370 [Brassica carinata]
MSDQFSQLKSILRSPSMSSTLFASAPVVCNDLVDSSENSEASSTDSDFTFSAPSSTSADNQSTIKRNKYIYRRSTQHIELCFQVKTLAYFIHLKSLI